MIDKFISVVIPTLQKDVKNLNKLIESLVVDEAVNEVIVIDNSLNGYFYESEKVKVLVPNENLFVNPSWNLGVKEAKNEYICLANDDIKISNNFCTRILEKFSNDFGIVGIDSEYAIDTKNESNEIVIDIEKIDLGTSKEVSFKPIRFRPHNFGIMMFFKKENYVEIPENLKIFFGDDWIIENARKKGKFNQVCIGQNVYHLGSLSSSKFTNVVKQEEQIYWNYIIPKYKRGFYYIETATHYVWFILWLKLSIKKWSNVVER